MHRLWNGTKEQRSSALALRTRSRRRLGLEELEIRDLPSVITPYSLAQELQRGFTGYTPAQMLAAYGFSQLSLSKPGQGETIAIVDAFEAPNIQTDVTTFDTQYNLPAINLTVVNDGATAQDPTGGWELETALDVEWAHAIAPYANIVLVEAANDNVSAAGVPTALLHAVSVAASQPKVAVVSMSWGVSEFKTETQYDSTFATLGITFVAASGDNGTPPIWPAVSPNVVAVGGTTLQTTSTAGVYFETGWGNGSRSAFRGGSGGGISKYETELAYQVDTNNHYVSSVTSAQNSGNMRLSPDVAYDANPSTGVAVYDKSNGGWFVLGGTSAGTPQWAALVALADQVRANATPAQPALSSTQTLTALYQEQGDFYDITSGNNGAAAGPGYDLVTGLGSPQANLLVGALAKQVSVPGVSTTDPSRTSTNPTPVNPPGSGSNADFTLTGTQIQATAGQPFTGIVATITGTSSGAKAGSFTATILWGDGTASGGTITVDPKGGFDVTGTHTYTNTGYSGWHWGWGGSRSRFGWEGGGAPAGSGNAFFRITVVVSDTTSSAYAVAYTLATVTPASATASLSSNQRFIIQIYQSLLGRTPDANGLAYWTNLLAQGTSAQAVVLQLEQSQEYLSDAVSAIFEKMLQRQADPTGLAVFVNLLAGGGTVEQVEALIAGSPEYFQTRGGRQVSGFLDALYADALDRASDPAGQAIFGQALSQGQSRAAVAAAIFGSTEYRQDLVQSYYQAYLGRPADSGSLAAFVAALGQHTRDQEVVAAIAGSSEYFQHL